ncbi:MULTISPECIES: DUF4003 family protein [unclassified Psychrobacillus]|uniref:DUF4003 family protein n=1 Tax=unclassified Psychrobacillus TaxID=2636677 RepID=UPI001469B892|nr:MULTISPECIES: DUF4003 family protein [unclassified Psychrobacillus]MCM3358591.1 DUF4003 domain-containing protein [Psychrobacillus sp. MER TA 171]NME05686.1 DUF4003 family protein [Psychrobacillus sp. BL-248-WT-3]
MMKIQKVEHNYNKLKEILGWSVDKRVTLSLAGYYTSLEKDVDSVRFNKIKEILKNRVSVFSPLRSHLQPLFTSVLDVSGQEPEEAIDQLLLKVEELKKKSFKMNDYTYVAALMMSDESDKWDFEISRAMELMSAMKVHHRFLTNSDDYPFAIFLGKLEGDITTRAATMNKYYEELKNHKFYAGNELQWLSQVLTYTNPGYDKETVPRVVVIRDGFKSVKIKFSISQYPLIGFMAALKLNENQLMDIVETYRALTNMKLFTWYKESALPIALGLTLNPSRDIRETTAISMTTSLELLLQAQQAMMISSIAATSFASSSNSN